MRLAFVLLGGGLAWAVHLLGSYAIIALACATGRSGAAPALIALTVACAAGAIAAGVLGLSTPRPAVAAGDLSPGADDPVAVVAARRFVRHVGVALSVLFTFLIVLSGFAPAMAPLCAAA